MFLYSFRTIPAKWTITVDRCFTAMDTIVGSINHSIALSVKMERFVDEHIIVQFCYLSKCILLVQFVQNLPSIMSENNKYIEEICAVWKAGIWDEKLAKTRKQIPVSREEIKWRFGCTPFTEFDICSDAGYQYDIL